MIHLILAQDVPGAALKNFMLIVGGLAATFAGITGGIWYLRNMRPENKTTVLPNPLPVSKAQEVATKRDLEALGVRIDALEARVVGREWFQKIDAELQAGREKFARLDEKIDETREQMAKGFNDVERSLGRVEGKLDNR